MPVGGGGVEALFYRGPITPGDVASWESPGVLKDGGTGSAVSIGGTVVGGTAGSILFIGAGSILAQDNANLFWDDTNNRLGIGTASPSTFLHVTSANTSGTDLRINNSDTGGKNYDFLSTGSASGYGAGRFVLWDGGSYAVFSYRTSTNVLAFNATEVLGWSGDGFANAAPDCGMARNGGIVEVNTGTKGTLSTITALQFYANSGANIGFKADATNDVVIQAASSNTSSTAFILNNSSTGGHNFQFFSTGQANNPGFFGVYDATTNVVALAVDGTLGNVQIINTGVLAWATGGSANTTTIDAGIGRNAAALLEVNSGVLGTLRDLTLRDLFTNDASFFLRSKTTITGGGTGNVPTLTAGPVTGNPTKWLPYDDNGTTRYIPSW